MQEWSIDMAISIGTDSAYLNHLQSNVDNKADKLQSTLSNLENATDEELMDACKSFEAYLLEQTFKSMESTIMKDEDEEENSGITNYMNMFGDTMYQSIAQNATETEDLGIAKMLYESMKRNS